VQLDAHADLRHEWLGSHHSHACAMRRCLEILPSGDLFQLAIRSGTKAEFQELHSSGRLMPTVDALREGLAPSRAARSTSPLIWTGLILPFCRVQAPLNREDFFGLISPTSSACSKSIGSWARMLLNSHHSSIAAV
jgi:hypothetical protein